MDAMLVSDEMLICLLLCFLSLQHVSLRGPQDTQAHDKRIRDQRDSSYFTWKQRFCEQGPLVLRISFYTDQSKEGAIVKERECLAMRKASTSLILNPYIKEQILISYPHTFRINVLGRSY